MSNEINVKVTIGLSEEFMNLLCDLLDRPRTDLKNSTKTGFCFPQSEGIDLRAQARSQKMVDDAKKKEIEKQQENKRKAAEYDKTVASQKLNPPPEKPKTDFPDDETFAKLPFEEMEALLTGENFTEFRVAAFARATEAKFPGKAKALAFEICPKEGFQGIKKDKLLMALFVQRIKNHVLHWVKAEENDIPF